MFSLSIPLDKLQQLGKYLLDDIYKNKYFFYIITCSPLIVYLVLVSLTIIIPSDSSFYFDTKHLFSPISAIILNLALITTTISFSVTSFTNLPNSTLYRGFENHKLLELNLKQLFGKNFSNSKSQKFKEYVLSSLNYFRRYWIYTLLILSFYYLLKFLFSFDEFMKKNWLDNQFKFFLTTVIDVFSTFTFFHLYILLRKPTRIYNSYSKSSVENSILNISVIILIIYLLCFIIFMIYTSSMEYDSDSLRMGFSIFGLVSGTLACIVVSLFAGKIDSSFISPPLFLVIGMYLYAALMVIFPLFEVPTITNFLGEKFDTSNINQKYYGEDLGYFLLFGLKTLLFLTVVWLFTNLKLTVYFIRSYVYEIEIDQIDLKLRNILRDLTQVHKVLYVSVNNRKSEYIKESIRGSGYSFSNLLSIPKFRNYKFDMPSVNHNLSANATHRLNSIKLEENGIDFAFTDTCGLIITGKTKKKWEFLERFLLNANENEKSKLAMDIGRVLDDGYLTIELFSYIHIKNRRKTKILEAKTLGKIVPDLAEQICNLNKASFYDLFIPKGFHHVLNELDKSEFLSVDPFFAVVKKFCTYLKEENP